MKMYKIVWDNVYKNTNYPLAAFTTSIVGAFECLQGLHANTANVTLDEDDLLYQLGKLYAGEVSEVIGDGFIVVIAEETE